MAVILDGRGSLFRPVTYENEAPFERDVVSLADQIFGPSTIYLDIKKRVGNDIVTIPDGYLIDTTEPDSPRLYVIENEIVRHDPFKHIGIQMLRFVTSFEEAQRAVRTFVMKGIQGNASLLKRLESACKKSTSGNIDHYLDRAVYASFKGLVVIDEARPELYRVLEKINADISVLELRSFASENGERLFQFDTLYDDLDDDGETEPEAKTRNRSPEERAARRMRRAECDTIVVPAREDGFQQVFLGEHQWRAIRIGAAMKDRVKYIAAYRTTPTQAVTHIAKVLEIKPYKDTGKYQVIFDGPAEEIAPVQLQEGGSAPQAPFYVQRERLLSAKTIGEAVHIEGPS